MKENWFIDQFQLHEIAKPIQNHWLWEAPNQTLLSEKSGQDKNPKQKGGFDLVRIRKVGKETFNTSYRLSLKQKEMLLLCVFLLV